MFRKQIFLFNKEITGAEGGNDGSGFMSQLNGNKGIYIMRANYPKYFGATGHATLFNQTDCVKTSEGHDGKYLNAKGGVYKVCLWILQ